MSDVGSVSEKRFDAYFEWKITDFFFLEIDDDIPFRCSPKFSCSGGTWNLAIYPRGHSIHSGWISLFLHLARSDTARKTVTYTFGVKKSDGTLEEKNPRTENFNYSIYRSLRRQDFDYHGITQFLLRDDLQKRESELVPSGTLTLTCRMEGGVPYSAKVVPRPLKLMELETLSKNFNDLFASKKKCDVTVRVKDVEFHAHKSVLVARSPVFAAMFEHDTLEEETGVVTLPDCDPDSFGVFLQYLYAGKSEDVSSRNVRQLYVAADKYDVQELKSFCVAYMMRNLSVENVCGVVTLADLYADTELLSTAQTFFNRNFGNIFTTAEWKRMISSDGRLANRLLEEMASNVKIPD